jgi:hypothetical protein
MQALVRDLRTLWHNVSSFEIGKISSFIEELPSGNPRFA